MANKNATGKKAKRGEEIVQRARALILKALDVIDSDPKMKMSDLLAEEGRKNPLKLMELASKYCPRETAIKGQVDHDHKHEHTHVGVSDTSEWVATMLGESEDRSSKKSLPH